MTQARSQYAPLVDSPAHVYTDMPLSPIAWNKPAADATSGVSGSTISTRKRGLASRAARAL